MFMTPHIKYFGYVRKSTDDKKNKRQVLSLPTQSRGIRELCDQENLSLIELIEEAKTAKQPGRPLFNAMLTRIERGEANSILVADIDRLYRNPFDEGRVRWMLQQNIIASIRTPTRTYTPEDAGLLIAVEGGRATDFIIHHKRRVANGIEEKLLRGEWPGQKPVGYVYDSRLRNIVPDLKRAKIVPAVFEEYAGGRHGLMSISARLFELGVKTRSGRPWSKWAVRYFLTNRLYIGIMEWDGKTYEGKYKPLVSPELFNAVQKVLKIKCKPRRVRNGHNFPFCGLFRCSCGSMMTAQWAKGNGGLYRYYRCTKKTGVCSEPYVAEAKVTEQCLVALRPLALSEGEASAVRAVVDEKARNESQYLEGAVKALEKRLVPLQEKLDRLTHGYLDQLIDEDSYRSAKDEILIEKNALKREKERLHRTGASPWIEPTREVINTLETLGKTDFSKTLPEISKQVQKIGTNRLISRKTVSFSLSEPYDFLPSLLASVGLTASTSSPSRSDENSQSPKWCA